MESFNIDDKTTFESALNQLEQIADALDQGEPALDEALTRYEQAVRLLAHCHVQIDGAERAIALLIGVDDQGQPVTAPFDATATPTTAAPLAEAGSSPKPRSRRKTRANDASPSRFPDDGESDPPF